MAGEVVEQTDPQPKEIRVVNDFMGVLSLGAPEVGDPVVFKTQPDGTVRAWSIGVGTDANGNESVFLTELSGEQRISTLFKDVSGALQSPLVNARNEQVIDITRTSWQGEPIPVDPVLILGANTVVHTVPALSVDQVEVELVSVNGTPSDITIFTDPSGILTGAAQHRHFISAFADQTPARFGPYHLGATGTVTLLATVANEVSAQATVWRTTP